MSDHRTKHKRQKWYHRSRTKQIFVVNTVLEETRNAIIEFLMLIICLPFCFYCIRKR